LADDPQILCFVYPLCLAGVEQSNGDLRLFQKLELIVVAEVYSDEQFEMLLYGVVVEVEDVHEFVVVVLYFGQFSEVVSVVFCADVVQFLDQQADVCDAIAPQWVFGYFEEGE
jgi:hypothetical protein